MQDDVHTVGKVIRNQHGHPDVGVDLLAVFELRGHPSRHLVSGPAHMEPLPLIG